MSLATVFTSLNPMEAQLIRSRLEAAGLHPEVDNEISALATGGYTLGAGGVFVKVPEGEATAARELIQATGSSVE
jgi:hypothetical protein